MADDKVRKSDEEWRRQLSPEQYAVTRQGATERPFSGKLHHDGETGVYTCVCCGAELFSTEQKYDSGSGWPSFWGAIEEGRIATREDRAHGMVRTEIRCTRCDAHLGHLFEDGPAPSGMRYCVNSLSLDFDER